MGKLEAALKDCLAALTRDEWFALKAEVRPPDEEAVEVGSTQAAQLKQLSVKDDM
jgi:hypothetical protein